ncbi:hypothetical protein KQI89_00510 [Clostridium sp. MSJ-4]|uniref:Uncharacterized protein n=1 Tax=Clostridium simiarum TaxID=2841506 RepID=A0ABS6EW76_9CLOT|nr:hypothetical protein [Clostridium simiarum]MBU5590238.1 hypothetical protein [Clostridium simiarum]
MKVNNIEVSGIVSPEEIKKYSFDYPCKEICKTFIISIPENKLPIDKLIYIFLGADITESKVNSTYKKNLFVDAYFKSQIIYLSNTQSPNLHSIDISRPFSEFLPIPDEIDDIDPLIFIEDAFVRQINSKEILISVFLLLCPAVNDIDNIQDPTDELNTKDDLNEYDESFKTDSDISETPDYDSQPNELIDTEESSNETAKKDYNIDIEYDMNSSEDSSENFFDFEWE